MSMKVLIADPDWRFARQATGYLESHAHLVVRHSNIADAFKQAEHWQVDLVILAAELAEKGLLEQLQALAPRPAILMTEHMDRYDRAWRVWQKGGDELLMKPVFKAEELHQAIILAMENATTGTRTRPAAATA